MSRERADQSIDPSSPVLYTDADAWHRLQYYVVTNHLGHLIHVLARSCGVDEQSLWAVVAAALRGSSTDGAAQLLTARTLPAKANLTSRFAGRSERPSYVQIPNPLCEVAP